MIAINQKTLGKFLIALAVMLFIVMALVKVDVDAQGSYLCEIVEDDPNLNMLECPAHQSPVSWLIIVAFAFVFLILASGIYLLVVKPGMLKPHAPRNGMGVPNTANRKLCTSCLKPTQAQCTRATLSRKPDFQKSSLHAFLTRWKTDMR